MEVNYRCRRGEIDIIAKRGDVFVFIEVKARSTTVFGHPLEYINEAKRKRVRVCAREFLKRLGINEHEVKVRFDAIGIVEDDVVWVENAF